VKPGRRLTVRPPTGPKGRKRGTGARQQTDPSRFLLHHPLRNAVCTRLSAPPTQIYGWGLALTSVDPAWFCRGMDAPAPHRHGTRPAERPELEGHEREVSSAGRPAAVRPGRRQTRQAPEYRVGGRIGHGGEEDVPAAAMPLSRRQQHPQRIQVRSCGGRPAVRPIGGRVRKPLCRRSSAGAPAGRDRPDVVTFTTAGPSMTVAGTRLP